MALPPALTSFTGLDQYFIEKYSTDPHTSSCVTSKIYKQVFTEKKVGGTAF